MLMRSIWILTQRMSPTKTTEEKAASQMEATTPIDQLEGAAADQRPGEPIRLRIPLMVWRRPDADPGKYQYVRGKHWNIRCDNTAEVEALCGLLTQFFAAVAKDGPRIVRQKLL